MQRVHKAQRAKARWTGFEGTAALTHAAGQRIAAAAEYAIKQRGEFLIVLAGGGTPRPVYELLAGMNADWPKWKIYYGDERCVAPANSERNSAMAEAALLQRVPISPRNIFTIPAELGPVAGASAYADTLSNIKAFDMVLLGIGEDGHTASLFPRQPWGAENDAPAALAVFNSPKAPSERVSLSAARLSRAHQVIFLIAGNSKRGAVTAWRRGDALPAAAIGAIDSLEILIESSLLN